MMRSFVRRTNLAMMYCGVLLSGACTEHALTTMGGVNDGGVQSDSGNVEVDAGTASVSPALSAVSAREVGRFGGDLEIVLEGTAGSATLTSARVHFRDGLGLDVMLFDTDNDGTFDSAEGITPLETIVNSTETYRVRVVFPKLLTAAPLIRTVRVASVDEFGEHSEELEAPATMQPIRNVGELCDPDFNESRCSPGNTCQMGLPSVCVEGTAPSIAQLAYIVNSTSSKVLVTGTDPDDDVDTVLIEFLDLDGNSVLLDLDGDGSAESRQFEADVQGSGTGGTFFVHLDGSFGDLVPKVAVTARDLGNRESMRRVVGQSTPTPRRTNEMCDPRGFDVCTGGVCSPGVIGIANKCVDLVTAKNSECTNAPLLDLGNGSASVDGVAEGPSLWDVPNGCSSGDPTDRPEGTVRVRLPSTATRLVLTTTNAFTNFDTTLYMFAGCSARPVLAWCADDTPGSAISWTSTLELHNVPAGDYIVAIDSFLPAGGRFRLEGLAEF